jgi:hypothetical protein
MRQLTCFDKFDDSENALYGMIDQKRECRSRSTLKPKRNSPLTIRAFERLISVVRAFMDR